MEDDELLQMNAEWRRIVIKKLDRLEEGQEKIRLVLIDPSDYISLKARVAAIEKGFFKMAGAAAIIAVIAGIIASWISKKI